MIFDCKFWAVVRVDIAHSPNGSIIDRDCFAKVEGIWELEAAARIWTSDRKPRTGPSELDKKYGWDYETQEYVVVSCADVKASCLSDLEDKLEKAAKLQVLGIGVRA